MNRAIFLTVALCLLVAPVFTLPADQSSKIEDFSEEKPVKHPAENEVNGDVNRDVEKVESPEIDTDSNPDLDADDGTDVAMSSVNGQIQGVIERHGVEGEFHCRNNFTCPEKTTRCTYDSKYGSGKNLEVHYKCTDKDGNVLLEKTQTESIESATNFPGLPDISGIFKQMETFMKNMFRGPFWGDDTSIEDNDDQ